MQRLQGLLLGVFDRNRVHIRTRRGGTDCCGVIGIVFSAQQVGLHILRREQPHAMAELAQFTPPEVGAMTGFDPDQARRKFRKESQDFASVTDRHIGARR
jgi:hypothetical protein